MVKRDIRCLTGIRSFYTVSSQNAFTQLQLCLRNNLGRSSKTAINDWSDFLEKLGAEMEKSVGENGKDVNAVRKMFEIVQASLESTSGK